MDAFLGRDDFWEGRFLGGTSSCESLIIPLRVPDQTKASFSDKENVRVLGLYKRVGRSSITGECLLCKR